MSHLAMDAQLKEISAALGRMIHGYQALGLLAAAADLDLWTAFREGPKTAAQLAPRADCELALLERVLVGLSMIGVIRRTTVDTLAAGAAQETFYQMTALGQAASDPRLPFADQILLAKDEYAPAWLHLGKGLKAGQIPFNHAFRQSVWHHRQEQDALGAAFDRVMGRVQVQNRDFILQECTLSSSKVLVDVGGGAGLLCMALLAQYPHLCGIVFDQPHLKERVDATIAQRGLQDRCSFSGGDFFTSVPKGDVLVLQHILHDWSDGDCLTILHNCRAAVGPGGRLFIFERLVGQTPQGPSSHPEAGDVLRDLHMLCLTGGRERSESEYVALLEQAGFQKVRSKVSGTGVDLLEAHAA